MIRVQIQQHPHAPQQQGQQQQQQGQGQIGDLVGPAQHVMQAQQAQHGTQDSVQLQPHQHAQPTSGQHDPSGMPTSSEPAQQGSQQGQVSQHTSQQGQGLARRRAGAVLSWRAQFARQEGFMRSMMCPRCGAGRVVPIVYGFPSPMLLEGMR